MNPDQSRLYIPKYRTREFKSKRKEKRELSKSRCEVVEASLSWDGVSQTF